MMNTSQLLLLLSMSVVALALIGGAESNGYHYQQPVLHTTGGGGGHAFAPLSTVVPLPPVPALPALPTPRLGGGNIGVGNIGVSGGGGGTLQLLSPAAKLGIAASYLPPPGSAYLRSSTAAALSPPTSHAFAHYGTLSAPAFGNSFYRGPKGRQLKQYAVVEIIDNDIEQEAAPFLPPDYFDFARAQIGASGTGAESFGIQLDSRADMLLQQQQQQQQQQQLQARRISTSPADAISLGSGGLGYVRLPNGNVYLGSGSLGYISSQQHQQLLQDVRTRSGAAMPDALHFGHGPLGGTANIFAFK